MADNKKQQVSLWFKNLRDIICNSFEYLETEYSSIRNLVPGKFIRSEWLKDRGQGGGGVMSVMRGNLFEKVGVNISNVSGELSLDFSKQIPGTQNNRNFFASGISVVSHMQSPLIPASHFNTRYIETSFGWFGGGSDLTPFYIDEKEKSEFHNAFKSVCDKYDSKYYTIFSQQCDEYFYLKHRNEFRGVGGIFYDYLNNSFDKDFLFTKDVGTTYLDIYSKIVHNKMLLDWTKEQRKYQLLRRGRYVEFNLLYDRGTIFGLQTGGNVDAILMSLPPKVYW